MIARENADVKQTLASQGKATSLLDDKVKGLSKDFADLKANRRKLADQVSGLLQQLSGLDKKLSLLSG